MGHRTESGKRASSGKASHALLYVFLALIALPALGAAALIATFDINAYRDQIAKAAAEKTGREVRLDGPVAWSLSLDRGFSVSVSDVTLGNPSWASRPDMARIGKALLHVDVRALLQKKLNIKAFELVEADVQLETSPAGVGNWEFKPTAPAKTAEKKETPKEGAPVAINVQEVKITQSRLGFRGRDGKLSVFEVPELSFVEKGDSLRLHYKGTVAGTAAEIDLVGGKMADLMGPKWPFNLQAAFADAKLDATGSLGDAVKKITLDRFALAAGKSSLAGQLTIGLGGARPSVRGKVEGESFDPSDLSFAQANAAEVEAKAAAKQGAEKGEKIFSREPLPLDGLKAVDAHIDLRLRELVLGVLVLKDIDTKLSLQNGDLTLAPLAALLAGSKTEGKIRLNASDRDAKLDVKLDAKGMEVGQLFKIGGAESAISGKGDLTADLMSSGRSSYDFAANAQGKMELLMDGGTVSSSGLRDMAGSLLDIFAPGAGTLAKPGIKCVAARYAITNGLMDTKGLLIDTDMTTIVGTGFINLPDEHINMNLRTRPKGVGLGSAVPPMKIFGNLAAPSFTLDTVGAIQKVAGLLTNGSVPADGVPTVLTPPAGQNACAYTLDNPAAANAQPQPSAAKGPLLPSSGTLQDTVKDVGDKIMQGIGKGLFGQ